MLTRTTSHSLTEQLAERFASRIRNRLLLPGTRLPSVRDVAAAHAINPMTVSKAYAQLEAQGVLERQRGNGMVVAVQPQEQRPQAERLQVLEPALRALALQARQLGLPPAAVLEALHACLREGTE